MGFVNFHENALFCITETPKSAEFTKLYEFPFQIVPSSTQITQNHPLDPKVTLALKALLVPKVCFGAKKSTLGPNSALLRPGAQNTNLELRLKA